MGLIERYNVGFISEIKNQAFRIFTQTDSPFHYYWIISFFVITLCIFGFNKKRMMDGLKFISNPVFRNEFKKDVFFWSLRFLYKPILFSVLLLNLKSIENFIYKFSFEMGIGFSKPIVHLDSLFGSVFIGLLMFIVKDFIEYVFHFLQHKIKWFWYFHMTHHFATRLTPLTKYRVHPVEYLFIILLPLALNVIAALFIFKMFKVPGPNSTLTIILVLNYFLYLSLMHFRHSHIKIHYGNFLSAFFMSPVMHQVHHSRDRAHYNKNMGVNLSIWDNIFNSMYIPSRTENLEFGIKGYQKLILKSSYWFEIKFPFILIFRDIKKFMKKRLKNKIVLKEKSIFKSPYKSMGFTLSELMITILLFSLISLVGNSIVLSLVTLKNNQLKIDSTETDLDLLVSTMSLITTSAVNVRYFNGNLNGVSSPPSGEGFVREFSYTQDATMGGLTYQTLMFFARETTKSNLNPNNTVSQFLPTGIFFVRKNESLDPSLRQGSQIVIDLGGAPGGWVRPDGVNDIVINNVSDVILDQPQYSESSVMQSIRMIVRMIYPTGASKGLECLGPSGDINAGITCNTSNTKSSYRIIERTFVLTFSNNKRDSSISSAEFENGVYIFPSSSAN